MIDSRILHIPVTYKSGFKGTFAAVVHAIWHELSSNACCIILFMRTSNDILYFRVRFQRYCNVTLRTVILKIVNYS